VCVCAVEIPAIITTCFESHFRRITATLNLSVCSIMWIQFHWCCLVVRCCQVRTSSGNDSAKTTTLCFTRHATRLQSRRCSKAQYVLGLLSCRIIDESTSNTGRECFQSLFLQFHRKRHPMPSSISADKFSKPL